MDLEILGVEYHVLGDYEIEGYIRLFKDILNNIANEFYTTSIGSDAHEIILEDGYYQNKVYGISDYLYSLGGNEDVESYSKRIYFIADEDEEYAIERNKGLTGVYYRRFTLKPEIQEIATTKFKEIIKYLEGRLEEYLVAKIKEKEKLESYKAKYKMGTIYHKQMPRGGEDGQDGFLDVDIVDNKTGEVIRFISKDIFDFGKFSFPKKYGGTNKVFERDEWTDQENEMANWLNRFGSFGRGIRQ